MFELRDYQKNDLDEIIKHYESGSKMPLVYSASPGAGKTLVASYFIDYLISKQQVVLVLTHGTIVLRSQFATDFLNAFPEHSKTCAIIESDTTAATADVFFAIPQSIRNWDIPADVVIIDEAHQYYTGDMVQGILKKINPKHTLLLTGTPSKFVAFNEREPGRFDMLFRAQMDIESEYFADMEVKLQITPLLLTVEDFSGNTHDSQDEVRETYIADLDPNYIDQLLTSCFQDVVKTGKTMIAARNIKQAYTISTWLTAHDITNLVSTSDNDDENEFIPRFKKENDQVLVVVRRGILGFSMPEIKNVIDMTLSKSIDRVYQLYARANRKSEKVPKKLFIKVAPQSLAERYAMMLNATLAMVHRDCISRYNGMNTNTIRVLARLNGQVPPQVPDLIPTEDDQNDTVHIKGDVGTRVKAGTGPDLVSTGGFPAFRINISLIERMFQTGNTGLMNDYALTDIQTVRQILGDKVVLASYPTFEECQNWCRRDGIDSISKYMKWYKSVGAPANPLQFYKKTWAELFGKTPHLTSYPTFNEVQEWCRRDGIDSSQKYMKWYKSVGAPSDPVKIYGKAWSELFGKKPKSKPTSHPTFEELQEWCIRDGIDTTTKYKKWYKSVGAPSEPTKTYCKTWAELFRREPKLKPSHPTFEELQKWCKRDGIDSVPKYMKWYKSVGAPSEPKKTYKKSWAELFNKPPKA